jgi:hypothetical protein
MIDLNKEKGLNVAMFGLVGVWMGRGERMRDFCAEGAT